MEEVQELIKVSLDLDGRSEVTREADLDDKWSGEDTYTFWNFRGLTRKAGYWDTFEIPKAWEGKEVFVVWVVYSTGDSFSHSENGSSEGIGIYSTLEEAQGVKEMIEADDKAKSHACGYSFSLVLPSGQKLSTPWKGYFESLTTVEINRDVVPS
jgi:hypothetical protein